MKYIAPKQTPHIGSERDSPRIRLAYNISRNLLVYLPNKLEIMQREASKLAHRGASEDRYAQNESAAASCAKKQLLRQRGAKYISGLQLSVGKR